MNQHLRQSTASQSRALGPFVSSTDFLTPQTGLTIANTDIKLLKNGAASVNKNSGGGTHRVNGEYGVTFDATDTDTVGELKVSTVVATALPVTALFTVLTAAVYDELYASAAPGYVATQVVGSVATGGIVAGSFAASAINAAAIAADAITAAKIADGAIDAATFAAGAINAAAIAADAIGASELAADAVAEIAAAVSSGGVGVEVIMLGYLGDLNPGGIIDVWFFTKFNGVATTLAGSPVISFYKDNSITQRAESGVSVDVDGIVGLHRQRVDFSADGTFYSAGSNFVGIITTGTVGGSPAVGRLVGALSLRARSALMATSADETLDVTIGKVELVTTPPTAIEIADVTQTRTIAGVTTVGIVNDVAALVITKNWAAADRTLTAFDPLVADIVIAVVNGLAASFAANAASHIKRNQALLKYAFRMTDATTHAPKISLTVTCTRSIDGGAFAAGTLANVAEHSGGLGLYLVDFGAADLDGKVIVLRATATGADTTDERIITVP